MVKVSGRVWLRRHDGKRCGCTLREVGVYEGFLMQGDEVQGV